MVIVIFFVGICFCLAWLIIVGDYGDMVPHFFKDGGVYFSGKGLNVVIHRGCDELGRYGGNVGKYIIAVSFKSTYFVSVAVGIFANFLLVFVASPFVLLWFILRLF